MGLKKDVPPTVADSAPATAATVPPAKAAPTAAKKVTKVADGETLQLLAVKRPISDPMTSVLYGMVHATPGIRKTGNWIDAQMNAGILKER